MYFRLAMIGLATIALAVMTVGETRAGGKTLEVNLTSDGPVGSCDPADCTLREAIVAANLNDGHDTITFDPAVFPPDPVTSISPGTEMNFVDAEDGITIGSEDTAVEVRCSACGQNFGLAFITDVGEVARDIVVQGVYTSGYAYDGMQVCGGANIQAGQCQSGVENVTISGGGVGNNSSAGFRVLGTNISGIELTNFNAVGNDDSGVAISGNSIAGATLENVVGLDNGIDGVHLEAVGAVEGVAITGGAGNLNGGAGYKLKGGIVRDVEIAGVTGNLNLRGTDIEGAEIGFASNAPISLQGNFADNTLAGIQIVGQQVLANVEIMKSFITGSQFGAGIHMVGNVSITDVTIHDNIVQNNGEGIDIGASVAINRARIESNGTLNNVGKGGGEGIALRAKLGTDNIISGNVSNGNNGHGIEVCCGSPEGDLHATLSRNHTAGNGGLGINLYDLDDLVNYVTPNDPGDADTGPNDLLNFPVLAGATVQVVVGTACAGCTVELFRSDNDPSGHGEGSLFMAQGEADGSGDFEVPVCGFGLKQGDLVTATATDGDGNTSENSMNYAMPLPSAACPGTPTPGSPSPSVTATAQPTPTSTPTATPTPGPTDTPGPSETPGDGPAQGDVDCDGDVDSVDALKVLRHVAGLPVSQTEPCDDIGAGLSRVSAAGELTLIGDVDCDEDVDSVDALKILRHVASLPVAQTEPCRDIGA